MNAVWLAFGLTLFAGMATGIGSGIAFFARRANYRFLSVATGFSAGVMLYVSFVEILPKGASALAAAGGEMWGPWFNAAAFFGGILFIGVIDVLIPAAENPHVTHAERERAPLRGPGAPRPGFTAAPPEGAQDLHDHGRKLARVGLFTALAIAIHNFPEGLATFLAALDNPRVGVAIAVAVALHNIPEGVSVAVPIFYATGSRRRAFIFSLLSGLAEPIGAVVGYALLRVITGGLPAGATGALFGGVAGVMVYISLDELLPASRAYGTSHDSLAGLIGGMAVMALSLLLLR